MWFRSRVERKWFLVFRESQRKRLKKWVGRYLPSDPIGLVCMAKVTYCHANRQGSIGSSPSLGADIDTLLIAPRHIERTDFFTSFQDLLLSEKGITNVRAVQDAFVPVIKIEYEGIEVIFSWAGHT